jgi:hypothetical protein
MVRRAAALTDADPLAQSCPKARVLKSEALTLLEQQAWAQLA